MEDIMISRPQKDSKSIGLIEANTILCIKSFRNGILSSGLVAKITLLLVSCCRCFFYHGISYVKILGSPFFVWEITVSRHLKHKPPKRQNLLRNSHSKGHIRCIASSILSSYRCNAQWSLRWWSGPFFNGLAGGTTMVDSWSVSWKH